MPPRAELRADKAVPSTAIADRNGTAPEREEAEVDSLLQPHAEAVAGDVRDVEAGLVVGESRHPLEHFTTSPRSHVLSELSTARRVILAFTLLGLLVVAALLGVVMLELLHSRGNGFVAAEPSHLPSIMSEHSLAASPSPATSVETPSETAMHSVEYIPLDASGNVTAEQFVWQYELCGRADSASEEADLSRLDVNHFMQPFGAAAFPSFTVPMSAVMPSFHTELKGNNPKPSYLEVYLLAAFWLPDSGEWKLAVNALYEGDAGIADSHYWHYKHHDAVYSVADKLELLVSADNSSSTASSSSPHSLRVRLDRIDDARGVWWLYFPSALSVPPPSMTSPPVLLSLSHPGMTSSSTRCEPTQAGWCSRPASAELSAASPFLRFSVCPRRYRPVEFSWCSNAIHSELVLPHIRSFLSYHAYLGIHRFVVFDRGGYRAVLQPFIDSGLVDYRYWPWVNRDYSSQPDNWSQQGLIALCTALHQHTSTYWGLFDFDEWLHIPRPELQLPSEQLAKARPVNELVRAALQAPLTARQPSTCLRFHPQPLAAEPDLSLDASAYSQHPHPLLHCESMLSWLFRALPLDIESANMQLSDGLLAAILSAGDVPALTKAIDTHRKFINGERGRYSHMHQLPILVFNFDETQQQLDARGKAEAEQQAAFELRKQHYLAAHNDSSAVAERYKGVSFTGSPQRFQRRWMAQHTNHKAFYRSSKPRDDTWIHPWSADKDFVNPNIARFNHYRNIYTNHRTMDANTQQRVSAQQPKQPHAHHAMC